MSEVVNWEEAYFETLAQLQKLIVENNKLKAEVTRLYWAANIQDQIDICFFLLYNSL